MSTFRVDVSARVTIAVADDAPGDVISRGTDEDFPYRIPDAAAVLEHLAYNAVANGVEDANRLDGWADLESGVLTMRVEDVEAR